MSLSGRSIFRFCHLQLLSAIETTYPFMNSSISGQDTNTNVNLPLEARIPSMTKNKAKEIAMIPFGEASPNTPGTTRRHKVK